MLERELHACIPAINEIYMVYNNNIIYIKSESSPRETRKGQKKGRGTK